MPLCIPSYETEKEYLEERDILIQRKICTIYMCEEGERIIEGGPSVLSYTISKRTSTSLKNAYIKLGNVPLGYFSSTPQQGIYIEEIKLPEKFKWKSKWPSLEKLVNCNIQAKIKEEFGIKVSIGGYISKP